MSKKLKKIPNFKNEDEEFEFWSTHDSTDYVDWSKAEVITQKNAFPNLKKTEWLTRLIILPKPLQAKLQKLAVKEALPAQILAEKILRDGLKRIAAR
jgi:hypothetical protein